MQSTHGFLLTKIVSLSKFRIFLAAENQEEDLAISAINIMLQLMKSCLSVEFSALLMRQPGKLPFTSTISR